MNRARLRPALLALALLVPLPALADAIGKMSLVEGKATRTPEGGAAVALAAGSEVHLKDTLEVTAGNAKLTLNDESVMMLGPGTRLVIREADFSGQVRNRFKATLDFGRIWSKVSKAISGSDAKFEVETPKAVAGVRGTIFRIDADKIIKAAKRRVDGKDVTTEKRVTTVRVTEGLVDVVGKVSPKVAKAAQARMKQKGERFEVPPPYYEVTKDKYEELLFVQLKQASQVTVGDDLWDPAPLKPANDEFDKFIDKHQ